MRKIARISFLIIEAQGAFINASAEKSTVLSSFFSGGPGKSENFVAPGAFGKTKRESQVSRRWPGFSCSHTFYRLSGRVFGAKQNAEDIHQPADEEEACRTRVEDPHAGLALVKLVRPHIAQEEAEEEIHPFVHRLFKAVL